MNFEKMLFFIQKKLIFFRFVYLKGQRIIQHIFFHEFGHFCITPTVYNQSFVSVRSRNTEMNLFAIWPYFRLFHLQLTISLKKFFCLTRKINATKLSHKNKTKRGIIEHMRFGLVLPIWFGQNTEASVFGILYSVFAPFGRTLTLGKNRLFWLSSIMK